MAEPTPIELMERLRASTTVPEMAKIVALIIREAGIHNIQAIGNELSRIAVTSGLGRN